MLDPIQEMTMQALRTKADRATKNYKDLTKRPSFGVSPFMGLLSLDSPSIYVLTVDLETTGFDPEIQGIWEIGVLISRLSFPSDSPTFQYTELGKFTSRVMPFKNVGGSVGGLKSAIYDNDTAQYHGFKDYVDMRASDSQTRASADCMEAAVINDLKLWLEVGTRTGNLIPEGENLFCVAYHASFEESFFNAWKDRYKASTGNTAPFDAIDAMGFKTDRALTCTRQLFKALQMLGVADPNTNASLDSLCAYYGLGAKQCNAMGDAIATTHVLGNMIVTLRAAMGIYEAHQSLAESAVSTLTASYALGPNCNIIEVVYQLIDRMRTHASMRGNRGSLTLMLCRDLAAKPGEFKFCVKAPDSAVSIALARDERKPLVLQDPRYEPILAVQYSQNLRTIITRRQTEGLITPTIAMLSECAYEFIEAAMHGILTAHPSDSQTIAGGAVSLAGLIGKNLPEASATTIGLSQLEAGMTEVAGRSRRLRMAVKKEGQL